MMILISHYFLQNRPVVDCDPLTNPDNGTVDTSQGTTLDQVATYSCNSGYVLVGNMTRTCQVGNCTCQVDTCQVDGVWSGTEPFCRKFKFYNLYMSIVWCLFSLFKLCIVLSQWCCNCCVISVQKSYVKMVELSILAQNVWFPHWVQWDC